MATLSKKIRLLEQCAAEDPERVIIELRDFWDSDYDVMDGTPYFNLKNTLGKFWQL